MNVSVGDKVIRFFEPGRLYPATMYLGHVTHVDDTRITCVVHVDIPRTMEFDKRSGRALNGDCWDFILPAKSVEGALQSWLGNRWGNHPEVVS